MSKNVKTIYEETTENSAEIFIRDMMAVIGENEKSEDDYIEVKNPSRVVTNLLPDFMNMLIERHNYNSGYFNSYSYKYLELAENRLKGLYLEKNANTKTSVYIEFRDRY